MYLNARSVFTNFHIVEYYRALRCYFVGILINFAEPRSNKLCNHLSSDLEVL